MKISESTSYPHPVLAPWKNDIEGSTFEVKLECVVNDAKCQLTLKSEATLDQPELKQLLEHGKAQFGIFVYCNDTGLREMVFPAFPLGTHEFAVGAVRNKVFLRPLVVSAKAIDDYKPTGCHVEFAGTYDLPPGQFLAIGERYEIFVSNEPLPNTEDLFDLEKSPEVVDGQLIIALDQDRIKIKVSEKTHKMFNELRAHSNLRPVLINALYVPIIMQILQLIQADDSGGFSKFRWFESFRLQCEHLEINLEKPDLLNDAHTLLRHPLLGLSEVIKTGEPA